MKNGAVLAAIGIGAFLGVIVVCGGLGGVFLWMIYDELQDLGAWAPVTGIEYTLDGPQSIQLGEPAIFTITVTNTSETEQRTLYSIDLYTELVGHGEVKAIPAAPSFYRDDGEAYGSLIYQRPLPPGETEIVEVTLNPDRPGRYSVNIDACIDSSFNFIERFHDVTVLPPDADGDDAATLR